MKVYAVAESEVQDDCVQTFAGAWTNWEDAVDEADTFMLERVASFLDIEASDLEEQRRRLDEHLCSETEVWQGNRRLMMLWRVDGACISATVQEDDMP